MRPDGVSGATPAQQPTLVERIDAVDISKINELSETLAGLKNDTEQEIKEAFADGKITKKESQNLSFLMSRFCSLNGQFKTAIRNASEELKNLYEQLSQSLSATVDRLTKASNAKNPDEQAVVVAEPEETDNQKPKAQKVDLKQLSNADLIAEAEMIKSQFHPEGLMKRDYESCFTNVWGSGTKITENDYRVIEGNLKKFQEKYKNELQNTGSSFDNFDNYSKIETQITYYTELAARKKEENNQQYLDALSGKYRKTSAERAQAWGKEMQKAADKERAEQQKRINEWLDKDS